MESLCAYQWHESARHKPGYHDPFGALLCPHKILLVTVTDGQNEASAGRELVY
jgi:hypothetical protein